MNPDPTREAIKADHTVQAIRARLGRSTTHSYLRDFVYGGIDGAVTTFAVMSGVAGAGLSSGVVIVLGLANLVGDGFSMAASNYLGSKADLELLQRARATEELHIEKYPEGEREEVRQLLAKKGFTGDMLEKAVATITADRELWVDTMLQDELGMALDHPSPVKAAAMTFGAFVVIGFLPLVAFLAEYLLQLPGLNPFLISTVFTGIAFFGVGAVKAQFVSVRWYWSGLETLAVGAIAASLAYAIGMLLSDIV